MRLIPICGAVDSLASRGEKSVFFKGIAPIDWPCSPYLHIYWQHGWSNWNFKLKIKREDTKFKGMEMGADLGVI